MDHSGCQTKRGMNNHRNTLSEMIRKNNRTEPAIIPSRPMRKAHRTVRRPHDTNQSIKLAV